MNEERARALVVRQQVLLARSRQLRDEVADATVPWQSVLASVDRTRAAVRGGWQWLRGHPEVPAGLAALVVLLRPKRALGLVWRWGRRGWLGWQLWKRVQAQAASKGVDLDLRSILRR